MNTTADAIATAFDNQDPIRFTDADGQVVVGRIIERFPVTLTPATVLTATGMCRAIPKGAQLTVAARYEVSPDRFGTGLLCVWDHRAAIVVRSHLTPDQARAAYCELAGIPASEFGCRQHAGMDVTCGNCA
jgi:hypothetical protein